MIIYYTVCCVCDRRNFKTIFCIWCLFANVCIVICWLRLCISVCSFVCWIANMYHLIMNRVLIMFCTSYRNSVLGINVHFYFFCELGFLRACNSCGLGFIIFQATSVHICGVVLCVLQLTVTAIW